MNHERDRPAPWTQRRPKGSENSLPQRISTREGNPARDWGQGRPCPRMVPPPGAYAVTMRCFPLRIHYGPDAAYPDASAVREALHRFAAAVGLPAPLVVDCGDGLECYWVLTSSIAADRWRRDARRLKAACLRHGLAADHRRTDDIQALWRPVGTRNHDIDPPFLLAGEMAGPYPTAAILGALRAASGRRRRP
jgi:hypothetical protein